MTKFDKSLHRLSMNAGKIGRIPSSAQTGIPAVNADGTMRLWSGQRMIYQMPFHPPTPIGLSNCDDFKYYPIFRFPDMASTDTVRLVGRLVYWSSRYNTETVPSIKWYPYYTPGSPSTALELYSGYAELKNDNDYGDSLFPWSQTIALEGDNFIVGTDGGAFFTRMLTTDSILPAALAIFRSAPQSAPSADWVVEPSDCAYGKPLRAYDSGTGLPGIGLLAKRVTTASVFDDYITTAVSTPLFAWGHHHGIWVGQGETDHNIFGGSSTIKITAKPIYKDVNQLLDVAIVCSAGVECTMTITGTGNADGYCSVTIPANANPGIAYSGVSVDALRCSTTSPGDLTFEVTTPNNSSANDWCIIHSISVYPANS